MVELLLEMKNPKNFGEASVHVLLSQSYTPAWAALALNQRFSYEKLAFKCADSGEAAILRENKYIHNRQRI